MAAQPKLSDNKYEELRKVVNEGRLIDAKKKELERYATIVCLAGYPNHFGEQGPHIAEMVRLMLLVRISEETQAQAMTLAKVALVISLVAAFFTFMQAMEAFGIIPPLESPRASQARSQPEK